MLKSSSYFRISYLAIATHMPFEGYCYSYAFRGLSLQQCKLRIVYRNEFLAGPAIQRSV